MAGRKPRQARDEQAGVTPLRGVPVAGSRVRRKADPKPCIGNMPAGDRTITTELPPFAFGHKINETHGMNKEQIVARELVEPYVEAVLGDPEMPDHLRSPQFAGALEAWARFQYLADRAFAKVAGQPFEEMAEPLGRSGQGKSLLELWKMLESQAARLRAELGMTPASYARLRASLGLAHQAEADALRKMASAGKEITSRRAAIEAPRPSLAGTVIAGPDAEGEKQAAAIGAELAARHAAREPAAGLYRPDVTQLLRRDVT